MKYTVKIDKQSCQSSGNCVDAHPSAFAWDDDDLGDACTITIRLTWPEDPRADYDLHLIHPYGLYYNDALDCFFQRPAWQCSSSFWRGYESRQRCWHFGVLFRYSHSLAGIVEFGFSMRS